MSILSLSFAECLLVVSATWTRVSNLLFFYCFVAEYYTLCPGGEGFRPNPITIILEGELIPLSPRFKQGKELVLEKSWWKSYGAEQSQQDNLVKLQMDFNY